jgi:hypothetical protein
MGPVDPVTGTEWIDLTAVESARMSLIDVFDSGGRPVSAILDTLVDR